MAHRLAAGLLKAVAHHPRWSSATVGGCLALAVAWIVLGQASRPAQLGAPTLPPSIQAYFQQVAKRIEEQGGKLEDVSYLGSFRASKDEDWSWFAVVIESEQGRQVVSLVITLDRNGTIVRVE